MALFRQETMARTDAIEKQCLSRERDLATLKKAFLDLAVKADCSMIKLGSYLEKCAALEAELAGLRKHGDRSQKLEEECDIDPVDTDSVKSTNPGPRQNDLAECKKFVFWFFVGVAISLASCLIDTDIRNQDMLKRLMHSVLLEEAYRLFKITSVAAMVLSFFGSVILLKPVVQDMRASYASGAVDACRQWLVKSWKDGRSKVASVHIPADAWSSETAFYFYRIGKIVICIAILLPITCHQATTLVLNAIRFPILFWAQHPFLAVIVMVLACLMEYRLRLEQEDHDVMVQEDEMEVDDGAKEGGGSAHTKVPWCGEQEQSPCCKTTEDYSAVPDSAHKSVVGIQQEVKEHSTQDPLVHELTEKAEFDDLADWDLVGSESG